MRRNAIRNLGRTFALSIRESAVYRKEARKSAVRAMHDDCVNPACLICRTSSRSVITLSPQRAAAHWVTAGQKCLEIVAQQTRSDKLHTTINSILLIFNYRKTGFGPPAPAAIHRNHIAVAHFLQIVGRQRGAEAASAVENDRGGFVRDSLFDIALDDAFAEVQRVGNITAGPFAFFA